MQRPAVPTDTIINSRQKTVVLNELIRVTFRYRRFAIDAGRLRHGDDLRPLLQRLEGRVKRLEADLALCRLRVHTIADLPAASGPARLVYVADETDGAVPAFNDPSTGTWHRLTDRAEVS